MKIGKDEISESSPSTFRVPCSVFDILIGNDEIPESSPS
jgi:hypothetical protein